MAGFLFWFMILALIWMYFIPVRIARIRNIPAKQRFFVFWLTVFGFFGITWLLALILALSRYQPPKENRSIEITVKQSRVDQLIKLSELKKDGYLTDEEFEKEKALLM